ncbi:hypothetical protein L1887_16904 [Cichorium endivia]|nr:hypothetical protein L1887_16904 [Cichorium endivia]
MYSHHFNSIGSLFSLYPILFVCEGVGHVEQSSMNSIRCTRQKDGCRMEVVAGKGAIGEGNGDREGVARCERESSEISTEKRSTSSCVKVVHFKLKDSTQEQIRNI